jgi:amino acid permease
MTALALSFTLAVCKELERMVRYCFSLTCIYTCYRELLLSHILQFNANGFFVFTGAVVVSFEGTGLILPVNEALSHRMKQCFPRILCYCMTGLAITYALFGAANYVTYGNETASFVTENLPPGGLKQTAIAAYVFSVGVTFPMQQLPAVRVVERWVFGDSPHSTTAATSTARSVFNGVSSSKKSSTSNGNGNSSNSSSVLPMLLKPSKWTKNALRASKYKRLCTV